MRIKFLQHVPIPDISAIPRSAYGAVGIRHPQRQPAFHGDGNITLEPVSEQQSKHFFRKNWCAELPDAMAKQFIDSGVAEASDVVVVRGAVKVDEKTGAVSFEEAAQ